ncbi:MAG: hypothetical protein OEW17_04390, partial [Gemmatimonadota bacterium]|nr:hypothetical protein [Gemmatimonadota bacterium]
MTRLVSGCRWFLLNALLVCAPAALAAQSPREGEADRVEWTVAPYFLIPTMSGDLTVGNQT